MRHSFTELISNTKCINSYFRAFLAKDRQYIRLEYIFLVLITLLNTVMIWLVGECINRLTLQEFNRLPGALLWLACVVAANQALQYAYFHQFNALGLRIIARVRSALLNHISKLSFPVYARFQKGDLIARLTNDTDRLITFLLEIPLNFFSHLLVMAVYSAMLVWIDWHLALVASALSPIFYLLQHTLAPRKGRAASEFFKNNGELLGFEDQSLENLRGISSYTAEDGIRRMHRIKFDRARVWAQKMRNIDALYNALFVLGTYICGVVIIYFGIDGVRNATLSIGALVSFIIYLGYLSVPVRGIAHIPIQINADLSAVLRVKALLSEKPTVPERDNEEILQVKRGGIEFKAVVFGYPNRDKKVFDGVSVTFAEGETVALVGPSGAGKSSLALLLMRFYDPQAGSICVDGVNIRSVSLDSLRKNIGVVWQETFLFNDTVRTNLIMANPSASDADLMAACKHSHAWEFIQQLPFGLETVLGAGGVVLSAGQCQRLSIAQAFLKNAPILVLDEAASALDSESEQEINSALNQLRAGRTTLIIAHRYSSIRSADRVVYFNGDGTLSVGLHAELMKSHSDYKNAVQWQTRTVQ